MIFSFVYVGSSTKAGFGDLGPKSGTLEDIDFTIVINQTYRYGDNINIFCTLTNNGDNATNISCPALTNGNLNFYIHTPNESVIYYVGPLLLMIVPSFNLSPGESYQWNLTIVNQNPELTPQWWYGLTTTTDKYGFPVGSYELFGNYSYDYSKWVHSNLVEFDIDTD